MAYRTNGSSALKDTGADTRPNFSSNAKNEDNILNFNDVKDAYNKKHSINTAASDLANVESGAVNANINNSDDSIDGTRGAEEDPDDGFANNVVGNDEKSNKKGGFFKKRGPILSIMLLLLGVGGTMFFATASQPFALVNNMLQNHDVASFSTDLRFKTTLRSMMKNKTIKVPEKMQKILKNVGVDLELDDEGRLMRMTYRSGDKIKTIDAGNIDVEIKDGEFGGKISKAAQNADIDSAYTSKAKTYAADRIGWEKNRYSDFDEKSYSDADVDEFKKIAKKGNVDSDFDMEEKGRERETGEVDDDGNPKTEHKQYRYADDADIDEKDGDITLRRTDEGVDSSTSRQKGEYESKIREIVDVDSDTGNAKSKLSIDSLSKLGGAATGAYCAYVGISQAVAAVTIAKQVLEMINLASGFNEAIQKCQAGDGTCRSMTGYLRDINKNSGFWQAASILSVFGAQTQGVSAGVANLENVLTSGEHGFLANGANRESWEKCSFSRIASGAADFISDIGMFFSFGISKLIQVGIGIVKSAVTATLAGFMVQGLIQLALDAVGIDPVESFGDKPSGEYYAGGTIQILNAMARSIGLSAGNEESVHSFLGYKQEVLANRAQYDRDTLSPFDTSSPNTFLGSLKNSLISFSVLNSANTLTSLLSTMGTMAMGSIAKILPSASAITFLDNTTESGECPLANSVGAMANANHCMESIITDMSSADITYEDAYAYLEERRQFAEESTPDSPVIKDDTELARYINFWTTRDTHLGLADGAITAALTPTDTGIPTIDGAIGAVPVVGSLSDMINETVLQINEAYIFGDAYVVGNEKWNNSTRDAIDNRYIQAFLEFDSVYYEIGMIEESSLGKYLDNYYEKNPIDKSYEGTLARLSGLTKEETIDTLALIDYIEYVDNYSPSSRLAFGLRDEKKVVMEEEDSLDNNAMLAVIIDNTYYIDQRERIVTI